MQWTFIFCVMVSSIIITSSMSVGAKQKRSLSFFKKLFFSDMMRTQENCTKTSQRKPYVQQNTNINTTYDVVDKNNVPKREQDEMKRKQTRLSEPESEENNENNLLTNYTNDQPQPLNVKNTLTTTNENPTKARLTKIENWSDDQVLINTEPIITSTTEDLNIDIIDYDIPKTNIMPSKAQFMNSKVARSRKYSYEQEKEKTIQIFTLDNNSDVTVTEINKQSISPSYEDATAKDIILNEPPYIHQIYPNITNQQLSHNMLLHQKHSPMVFKQQHPLVVLKQQHPHMVFNQQHPLVILKQQHPLLELIQQHPHMVHKQHHPHMVFNQQHPLLELKQQHPHMVFNQQHPLLELKQQHPHMVFNQQHPLLELKQQHTQVVFKQQHPQVVFKQQYPQVVLKQQDPQVVLKQQDPQVVLKQQHPQVIFKQQHPHVVLKQLHPQVIFKQQYPQMVFKQQHPQVVLTQQHPHMVFNQQHPLLELKHQHPHFLVKQQHAHMVLNQQQPDFVLKQQHTHKVNQQYEKLGIKILPNSPISMYTGKPILVLDNTTETTKTSVSFQDVIINKTLNQSTKENLRGDISD